MDSSIRRTNPDDDDDDDFDVGFGHLHQITNLNTNGKRRHPQTQVSTIEPITPQSEQPPDRDAENSLNDFTYFQEWLLLEILVRLPVKSIFRFKCVCKHWLSIISDPSFARSYVINRSSQCFRILYRYIYVSGFQEILCRLRPDVYMSQKSSLLFLSSFEEQQQLDQYKVLAMSNGLFLYCLLGPLIYYVCDPVTGQWVSLPRPGKNIHFRPAYTGEGLVSRVNDENVVTSYKVVRVEWIPEESNVLNLEAFSSDTGEWREVKLFVAHGVRLLKRGVGPILFNGILHWFTYEHGMVAFDPYKNAREGHLINLPEGRDTASVYKYDGIFRMCDECQGHLRYFETAPDIENHFCFSMWELKDYDKGEWYLEHQATLRDIWSDDPNLNGNLLRVTFVPLAFHPFKLDVVYLRCVELCCIVSYSMRTKKMDVTFLPISSAHNLSWRVLIPFVLPMWPTPVPPLSRKAIKSF
ncbi:F-box protein At1g49990-like [Cornus florida]|uniref:F-box protein At1g49990-like n=1 Tax=Cornus florida TaxID=4283 RepID=UPI00289F7506|nr:F-box protein At1g49990-like [Cornus florida]